VRVTDAELPRLAEVFDINLLQASSVITAFAAGYGLMQLLYGPLGERYGKYRVATILAGTCALTSLLCALAPSLAWLIAARALAGATAAGIVPLSLAWIGDTIAYEQRRIVMARFIMGQISGLAAGSFLGGVAAQYLDWRAPFVVLAVWFATVSTLLLRLGGEAMQLPPSHVPRQTLLGSLRTMTSLFGRPWPRVVLIAAFAEACFFFGAFSFIPATLHELNGMSLAQAGSVAMALSAGGIVYALLSGPIIGRLREAQTARLAGFVMALALPLVTLAPGPWTAAMASALSGFGYYMMHNTLQVSATQMAPESRGVAVTLFAAVFFLGQSIGTSVVAALVHGIGPLPVFLGCSLMLAALGLGFGARHPSHNAQPRHASRN
jgi:predicted MFS family arabinose efflux permease